MFFYSFLLSLIKLLSFSGYTFATLFGTACSSNRVSCNVASFMYFLKLLCTYSAMESGKFHELLSCSDEGSNFFLSPLLFWSLVSVAEPAMFLVTLSWCILAVWFRAGGGGGWCTTGWWWSTARRTSSQKAAYLSFFSTLLCLILPWHI